jgi:hypothetical protein
VRLSKPRRPDAGPLRLLHTRERTEASASVRAGHRRVLGVGVVTVPGVPGVMHQVARR